MTNKPRRTEEEIAREYRDRLLREFNRKKLTSVLVVLLFAGLGVTALAYQLPMVAFCCLMVMLIGGIRYWDAAGQVDDIRRQPVKFLHAPLSLLQRTPDSSPTSSAAAKP